MEWKVRSSISQSVTKAAPPLSFRACKSKEYISPVSDFAPCHMTIVCLKATLSHHLSSNSRWEEISDDDDDDEDKFWVWRMTSWGCWYKTWTNTSLDCHFLVLKSISDCVPMEYFGKVFKFGNYGGNLLLHNCNFGKKFRESNVRSKEVTRELIWRSFFYCERILRFPHTTGQF